MKRLILLIILDGWGVGERNKSNPIHTADLQTIEKIKKFFPFGSLAASGIAVGLPWGAKGDSDFGHLILGAGKVIYESYPRISLDIRKGSFFENPALKKTSFHVKKYDSSFHLIGLLSSGNLTASLEHLFALLEFAKRENLKKVNLHLFTDGKDSPPSSSKALLEKLNEEIEKQGRGKIATLSGRFYALDNQENWERTERVYQVMVGNGQVREYDFSPGDEFIVPTIISDFCHISDNDALVFFNFQEDFSKQIISPFALRNFSFFPTKKIENLFIATMTDYGKEFKAEVISPQEKIENPLSNVLSVHNKSQLKISESEKASQIAYFFNGFKEEPFPNEYRVVIPSLKTPKPEKFPEMRAKEITERAINGLKEKVFDFILINYANPDVIGHSGDFEAGLKVAKILDKEITRLLKIIGKIKVTILITSSHGNMEKMVDLFTGLPEISNTANSVPFYLISQEFKKEKSDREIERMEKQNIGLISDVAPTILDLLGITKPEQMTGNSLLPFLLN